MKQSPKKNDPPRGNADAEREPTEPLTPRPRLFVIMAIVLALLMGGLLTLYFKTVFPNRAQPHAVEIDKLDEPASPR